MLFAKLSESRVYCRWHAPLTLAQLLLHFGNCWAYFASIMQCFIEAIFLMMKITKEFFRITTKWCDASFYEHNKKANPIFDIDGCKKRSIHNIRSSRSSIFRFPLKIENPSQKEHNRILYGAGGRDPTIMYLLRALKYQLLSSSKMNKISFHIKIQFLTYFGIFDFDISYSTVAKKP